MHVQLAIMFLFCSQCMNISDYERNNFVNLSSANHWSQRSNRVCHFVFRCKKKKKLRKTMRSDRFGDTQSLFLSIRLIITFVWMPNLLLHTAVPSSVKMSARQFVNCKYIRIHLQFQYSVYVVFVNQFPSPNGLKRNKLWTLCLGLCCQNKFIDFHVSSSRLSFS